MAGKVKVFLKKKGPQSQAKTQTRLTITDDMKMKMWSKNENDMTARI